MPYVIVIYVHICMNPDSKQLDSKLKLGLISILPHMHIPINMSWNVYYMFYKFVPEF